MGIFVFPAYTATEMELLESIRRRKLELQKEIQVWIAMLHERIVSLIHNALQQLVIVHVLLQELKNEIAQVTAEMEGLELPEER